MLGVIFTFVASLFEEISTAIGKTKVAKHEESLYSLRFLSLVGGALIFGLFVLLRHEAFGFAPASIIIAAKRSSAVLFTVVSGRLTFHETHILTKVVSHL